MLTRLFFSQLRKGLLSASGSLDDPLLFTMVLTVVGRAGTDISWNWFGEPSSTVLFGKEDRKRLHGRKVR